MRDSIQNILTEVRKTINLESWHEWKVDKFHEESINEIIDSISFLKNTLEKSFKETSKGNEILNDPVLLTFAYLINEHDIISKKLDKANQSYDSLMEGYDFYKERYEGVLKSVSN